MDIEKIFKKISGFENITLDIILFESKYPVMFTCKNSEDVYLFICCLVNASKVKWIGTMTNYDILISLLENRITILEAFLGVTQKKVIIEYDGQTVISNMVESKKIQKDLLPTAGEYMDAEGDEYAEEIAVFKLRNTGVVYSIRPQINKFLLFNCTQRSIMLTDEYFNLDFNDEDMIEYSIRKIQGQGVAFA